MDRCTVLLENCKSELKSAKVAPGLSLLIEAKKQKFLFDFGSNDVFLYNAKLMNINLNDLDFVAISESHFKHASGFTSFIDRCPPKKLIVGKEFFYPKYSQKKGVLTYLGCGFDKELLEEKNIPLTEVDDFHKICDGLYFMNNFEKRFSFENIPNRFVRENNDIIEKDQYKDEMVIIIENEDSLTLITSTSRQGILSTITKVNEKFDKKVTRVISGIDVTGVDDLSIEMTVKYLVKLGVKETFIIKANDDKLKDAINRTRSIHAHHVSIGDIIMI
jgi:7,8-dihydropterin-6-yl-methyl-4-(beta-D-ribofuranosyl)aminobenzene 5'-phosphate synthase